MERKFEYRIDVLSPKDLRIIKNWCEENIGRQDNIFDNEPGNWNVFWSGGSTMGEFTFYFTNDKDLTLFALKWS